MVEQGLKIAMLVAKQIDTETFKEFGFESCQIGDVKFDAIRIDDEIDITATVFCDKSRITLANATSDILSHSIATCVMQMLGFDGKWSFNDIQKEIEKKEQDRLETSMFYESLGWDN